MEICQLSSQPGDWVMPWQSSSNNSVLHWPTSSRYNWTFSCLSAASSSYSSVLEGQMEDISVLSQRLPDPGLVWWNQLLSKCWLLEVPGLLLVIFSPGCFSSFEESPADQITHDKNNHIETGCQKKLVLISKVWNGLGCDDLKNCFSCYRLVHLLTSAAKAILKILHKNKIYCITPGKMSRDE